ncbi:MAG: class II aldolase [Olsenella sp.]|jgi:ketose-bisphosphate aldolase|uniref:class II aldolase n=1 Tax=unclassified Olsenella TaxID=2638792 RepID=UPI000E470709|nr:MULTISPECIES: class II aldolase [unclassified Olsenella]MCI1646438.1 class II aldolase [Olsenella sp.]MCI1793706.1 class II aldolase [Olsenella sp.]MCI1811988.1 class II aldolase [Olsenella sp.]MCI1879128.1 class II aldolase [Olsenella sp.]MCR5393704.1 class II aldolase [Olsenella sp.]
MPLVNMNDLFKIAKKNKLMVPAYNSTDVQMTLAIMDAFQRAGMPGIVQVAPTNVKLTGYEYIAETTKMAAEHYVTPFALHLDHGKTLDDVRQAVEAGFTSVMIDGAALPFEENIRFSREAVDFAHCYGVPVEAELGALKGKEDDHVSEADCHTDPAQVEEFCDRTGCDSLAVSIGNVHGLQEKPKIDLNVLAEISKVAPVPLVLHGGSGIPFETIRAMRQYGMMKINIASDLRQAYIRAVAKRYEENHEEANLVSVLMDARNAVSEMAYDLAIEINKDVLIGKFAEQVA